MTATWLAQRFLALFPVLFGITVVVFLILHLTPGDPAQMIAGPDALPDDVVRIREQLGLDQPLPLQFASYLGRLVRGDLGTSLRTPRRVLDEILTRLPRTLELAVVSLGFAILIGLPMGVLAALKRSSLLDNLAMLTALLGVSLPSFWLGLLVIIVFAGYFDLLPVSGHGGPIWTLDGLRYALLPGLTLGAGAAAYVTRLTRSSMLEAIREDYVRTARAKGLGERLVVFRHALPNALIPVTTMLGLQFGNLLAGSIIVETVFSWPGLGRLLVTSIYARDYPVVQGAVLVMGAVFVLINLLVDTAYALIDPRIKTA